MNKYRILIWLMAVCFTGLSVGVVRAQTYDATGTWVYQTSNHWVNPGTAGCSADSDSQGTATITQTGSNVTLTVGSFTYTGTVSAETYTVKASYADSGGITSEILVFTLSSADLGSGTIEWSWTDGVDSCNGGGDFDLARAIPPTYDASGAWDVQVLNQWVNPGTAGCTADPDAQDTATIIQTGNNVTLSGGGNTYTGTVNGATYSLSTSYPEDGGTTTETITFTLTSSTAGSGTGVWDWTDGVESCDGGFDITFNANTGGGGGGGTNGTGGGGGGGCFIPTFPRLKR